jgi:hypothetical protein
MSEKEKLIKNMYTLTKYEGFSDDVLDTLKKALQFIIRSDNMLEAYKHYYNGCLKDLKKAHADIEEMKAHPEMYNVDFLNYKTLLFKAHEKIAVKKFCKMLVDRAEYGLIHIEDISDYVCEWEELSK